MSNDVANRHIGGALALLLGMDDIVGIAPLRREAFVQPSKRGNDEWILFSQATNELRGECRGQYAGVAGKHAFDWFSDASIDTKQAIGA